MNEINIKPLTVNQCWQGRRFKTPAYKIYEETLLWLLPKGKQIQEGHLEINLEFGVSNIQSDWDNPIKPFVDILQKKYNFNDKWIMKATVQKVKTKKGEEYIKYEIKKLLS